MINRTSFSPLEFWIPALAPIKKQVVDLLPASQLARWYYVCQNNHFGNATLETFFDLLKENKQRLVLMLDRIDELIVSNISHSADFFGGLRRLASRNDGALTLVVTSRLSLSVLNDIAKEFSHPSRPYFDGFEQIILGSFPQSDITSFLNLGNYFTSDDKQAIRIVAGRHPFLLQVAAAAMWDAWEDSLKEASERRRYMGRRVYRETKQYFDDTWRVWSPMMRKAFILVALVHVASMISEESFLDFSLRENLNNCKLELDDLEATGILAYNEQESWRVATEAILWWLATEFVQAVRAYTSFENWLKINGLDSILTDEEREQLEQTIRKAVKAFQQGGVAMIEKFSML